MFAAWFAGYFLCLNVVLHKTTGTIFMKLGERLKHWARKDPIHLCSGLNVPCSFQNTSSSSI